ncbi:MAG: tetratricopeptide repeat protein [Chloroflexi bacterium]|nr:MAG: tetratricopeptide repeat protein [Chloroflexota bacterium]
MRSAQPRKARPVTGIAYLMRSVPLVSLLLFAGLLAACAGSSNRSPSSPLPSGTPIDLALADRMYAEGDTDSASVIYSNAVTSGSLAQKQEAALKLARIAYSGGDEHGAAGNARALLESSPPAETQRRAYLLLGYSELAQGHDAPAKAAFEKYVQSRGPALPYAQLKLADIASRNKDSLTAERLAAAALTAGLPPQSETDALFALARYQKSNGETDGAAATYKRLVEHGATSTDRGEALWQGAQLAAAGGDVSTYVTSLRSLVAVYPSHERALQALQDPGIGTPAERAYVQFRNRLNDEATASYQALIADGDPKVQGDAHYHLGILAERAGDPDGALNEYTAAITALNGSGDPLLGDAYWDSATVLEAAGRPDEAVEHYSAVFEAAPGSDHAAEGLFRAGLIRYRQAGPGDAAGLWSRYLSAATAVEDKARGHFWLARAEGAAGQAGLQAAELRAAETAAPLSYYGLRARARAAAATPAADPPTLPDANPDPARTEAWLAAAFGAEPTPTAASRLQSDGWRRAVELLGAGLAAEADEQFDQVIDSSPAPWDLYRMARAMKSAGRVRPAARAAQALAGRQSDPRRGR